MTDQPPEGRRFTHVYVDRGTPLAESPRLRSRLAALVQSFDDFIYLPEAIAREIGLPVPFRGGNRDWHHYFAEVSLHDLLDTITVAWQVLVDRERTYRIRTNDPQRWIAETRRLFLEENVYYRVDNSGGVHFAIDEQFERNRVSSLQGLDRTRYLNVAQNFEAAYGHLSAVPPEGKQAIRDLFAAVEGLYRLMFQNAPRLDAGDVRARLEPLIQRLYAADIPALRAATRMIGSFAEWVGAAQFYKHEPGSEEPIEPPLELTVHVVSTGTSHLRWLLDLDMRLQPS